MKKITDIKYNVIKHNKEIGNSFLQINIKGSNINCIIVNTIRRTILSDIPIYAFTDFNFKNNESIFNNNYIKLRLNNLPVWGIPNKFDNYVLEKKIIEQILDEENENINIDDDIDLKNEKNINTSSLNQLTMYVDYTNNNKSIITVTTDLVKFYYAEKNIPSPYKIAIPIIKLQPDQNINFSAITTLGTEKENSIYSSVAVCYYNEINENEFNFMLESRGQLKESRIIEVALINIITSIENLIKIIPTEQISLTGEIIINGENNTIGNLISNGMQNHSKVKFAGYNLPHLLEDKVIIHYELINEKIKLKEVLNDVVIYFIELFKKIIELNSNI